MAHPRREDIEYIESRIIKLLLEVRDMKKSLDLSLSYGGEDLPKKILMDLYFTLCEITDLRKRKTLIFLEESNTDQILVPGGLDVAR